MIDYNVNDLMDDCIKAFKETCEGMKNVPEFMSQGTQDIIDNFLDKCLKRKLKQIKREDRKYQRRVNKLVKQGKIVDPTSEESVLKYYAKQNMTILPKPATVAQPAQDPKPATVAQPAQDPKPATVAQPAQDPKPATVAQPAQDPKLATVAQPAQDPKPINASL